MKHDAVLYSGAMALNQWYKFYGGEYLSDPKIASLSAQERSCWVTILCLASISSTPGTIEYLTVEVLLEKSGIHFDPYSTDEWDRCMAVLEKFARMKMITKTDDGTIVIKNWTKRQEMALTNAERQANYRRRNGSVTPVTTTVTVDKIRVDKNKDNFAEPKLPSSKAPLEPLSEVKLNQEGEEVVSRQLPKKDKVAWALMQKLVDMLDKQVGTKPVTGVKEYVGVQRALKSLKESDIVAMVQDAIDDGSAEKKGLSLAAILSNIEINKYRLRQ